MGAYMAAESVLSKTYAQTQLVDIWALRAHKETRLGTSLEPHDYIHLGLVDWKRRVTSGPQKAEGLLE